MDPLTFTCPVCEAAPGAHCIALDYRRLPGPHPERGAHRDTGSSMFEQMVASVVAAARADMAAS